MVGNPRKIITILIAVIIILVVVLVYVFAVKPQISGFVSNKQNEGYLFAYSEILKVVSQCKTFSVPVDNNGTVINLVALECLQGNSGVASEGQ